MGIGLIWMFLFWGGLILLAIWLVGLLFPTGSQRPADDISNTRVEARDILDRRYARGELSREQYVEMRQTIGQ